MSGKPGRSVEIKRSINRLCLIGSTPEIPSKWLTKLPAPEPRAATRTFISRIMSTTWATVNTYPAKPIFLITDNSESKRSRVARRSSSRVTELSVR